MKIFATIAETQRQARSTKRVLVPTMGALHKAHGELIRVAREHAGQDGEVAVSIFVNPLQFELRQRLRARYPRPESADEYLLAGQANVDLPVSSASLMKMYFEDRSTFVDESLLSNVLEGSKPVAAWDIFAGVCTVVSKLFNIVSPDAAVFGEKDFQQLAIVRRMVRDLNFKIEIIGVPTVREEDGLACSSRNVYLSPDERSQAVVLREALQVAKDSNEKSADKIIDLIRKTIATGAAGKDRFR